MAAAENGALPGGKVGGMGDVLRELPIALARRGIEVTVVTPSYGRFSRLPGARLVESLDVAFAGRAERVETFALPQAEPRLRLLVLEHALFSPNGDRVIYHDDGAAAPFFTDAGKFAFFSACIAELALVSKPAFDVAHLHDWHTGLFFALRAFDARYAELGELRAVFTIHNLALQGTRPLEESDSSLRAWFPDLAGADRAVGDPHHASCVNPMAAAIRLADMVNTVSPSYAAEILRPNSEPEAFQGGEGLENELRIAHGEGRLVGILNGCDYSVEPAAPAGWKEMLAAIEAELMVWIANQGALPAAHYLAERRLRELPGKRPDVLLTSVGRLAEQKARLFREPTDARTPALEQLLARLGERAVMIVLGSGSADLQRFIAEMSVRYRNLLFLQGYSDRLAELLYSSGDLFLMPSSYEPCGISQMLAMRSGQPCVVHAVGGLRDTVTAENGFAFDGDTRTSQATSFVATVERALEIRATDDTAWQKLKRAAALARFDWAASAARYVSEVYAIDSR